MIDIGGQIVYYLFSFLVLLKTPNQNIDWIYVLMMISILLKIQVFLRINTKMGLLVTLILTCLNDVVSFTIYLMIWMMGMTVLYGVIGIGTSSTAYAYIEDRSFINYFLQVWENSIGNITAPDFIKHDPSAYRIFAVYVLWFFNQFFVLIILLNFLIAVIS